MIRKSEKEDLKAIEDLYDDIHSAEEAGLLTTGWKRGIYPTAATALKAFENGELFSELDDGNLVGAGIINQKQVDSYKGAPWSNDVPDSDVMVLHTLTITPKASRKGYGKAFVAFYEDYAREHGCHTLRMDTNARNAAARSLYAKLGYKEIAIVSTDFNGLEKIDLVLLEKLI